MLFELIIFIACFMLGAASRFLYLMLSAINKAVQKRRLAALSAISSKIVEQPKKEALTVANREPDKILPAAKLAKPLTNKSKLKADRPKNMIKHSKAKKTAAQAKNPGRIKLPQIEILLLQFLIAGVVAAAYFLILQTFNDGAFALYSLFALKVGFLLTSLLR